MTFRKKEIIMNNGNEKENAGVCTLTEEELELACGGMGEDSAPRGKTGMTCPKCGRFIPTSITELLTQGHLRCPHCLLVIKINREK